jgi:hypothetical protein
MPMGSGCASQHVPPKLAYMACCQHVHATVELQVTSTTHGPPVASIEGSRHAWLYFLRSEGLCIAKAVPIYNWTPCNNSGQAEEERAHCGWDCCPGEKGRDHHGDMVSRQQR